MPSGDSALAKVDGWLKRFFEFGSRGSEPEAGWLKDVDERRRMRRLLGLAGVASLAALVCLVFAALGVSRSIVAPLVWFFIVVILAATVLMLLKMIKFWLGR